MKKVATLAGLTMVLASVMTARAATAFSPEVNWVVIWEPFKYEFYAPNIADEVLDRVCEEWQGYATSYRLSDNDGTDTSVGGCTRSAWDSLIEGAGIILVLTHGSKGFLLPVGVGTVNNGAGDDYAQAWKDAGSDNNDIDAPVYWDRSAKGLPSLWALKLRSPWFSRNWQSTNNDNKAIVVCASCWSATAPAGGNSVLSKIGGRVRIGWKHSVNPKGPSERTDMSELFGRMNGRLPVPNQQGTKRKFGAAWNDFTKESSEIVYEVDTGGLDTTLCPAVQSITAACGVCTIVFDTHCDQNQDIDNVVSATGTNATVGYKTWVGDQMITIDYVKTGDPASLSITIKADHVIQKNWNWMMNGKLLLDGNLLPENTTPANAGGVAPSADNYVKTVTLSD